MKKSMLYAGILLLIGGCQPRNTAPKDNAIAQNTCCDKNEVNATCSGTSSCTACKNCKYCKHCSKDGGSCGVCK